MKDIGVNKKIYFIFKYNTFDFIKSDFVRHVSLLVGGTVLAQAIPLLASPLLTRLYNPEDWGVLGIYSSILSVLVVAANWRYELAIPLAENDKEIINLVTLCFCILLLMSFITGLVVLLWGDLIFKQTKIFDLSFWLFPVGLSLLGTYQILNYWAVRRQRFDFIARTKFYQGLGYTLTQIFGGVLFGSGTMWLILGYIVGQCAGLISLLKKLMWIDGVHLKMVQWREMKKLLKRYKRFPFISAFSGIINIMGLQIPVILMGSLYGAEVGGWFVLANRVLSIPMSSVGQAVSQVYLGSAVQFLRDDVKYFRKFFFKIVIRLLWVGAIPLGVFSLIVYRLVIYVFGDKWEYTGLYLQFLCLSSAVEFIIVPLSQTVNILERQDLQLKWDFFRFLIAFFSIFLTFILGGNHLQAVRTYSLASIVTYIVLFFINLSLVFSTPNPD